MGFLQIINDSINFKSEGNKVLFDQNATFDLKEIFERLNRDYLERVLPQKQKDRKALIEMCVSNQGENDERSVATDAQ
jgi:hypothetical protein